MSRAGTCIICAHPLLKGQPAGCLEGGVVIPPPANRVADAHANPADHLPTLGSGMFLVPSDEVERLGAAIQKERERAARLVEETCPADVSRYGKWDASFRQEMLELADRIRKGD